MTYADTDCFLALIKEKDWLQSRAQQLFKRYKNKLWTSLTTILELLLLADRLELDAERIVIDAMQIAELRGVKIEIVLLAAHLMKQKRLRTFDAVHAAFAFDEARMRHPLAVLSFRPAAPRYSRRDIVISEGA